MDDVKRRDLLAKVGPEIVDAIAELQSRAGDTETDIYGERYYTNNASLAISAAEDRLLQLIAAERDDARRWRWAKRYPTRLTGLWVNTHPEEFIAAVDAEVSLDEAPHA